MKTLTQILHLEDDHQDAELVQAMLEAAEIICQITRLQTGAEFEAALRQGGFDLILADYRLPGYNGISALQLAQELCPDVPFIFVSGVMGEDAAIEGLTQGATDYVLKHKLARLAPAVKRALAEAEKERERQQMAAALAAREQKFRTLAENSPDNIARYDVNCRTIYLNPALEKTLGRPASELLGTTPMEAAVITEHQGYQEKLAQVLKTGINDEMDLVMPDRGEGIRYHNVCFVAERGADGAITGVQAIGRDMTEHKRHELEREAVITVSNALRKATNRAEILTVLLDQLVDLFAADGAMLATPQPATDEILIEMGRGELGQRFSGLRIPPGQGISGWIIQNRLPYLNNRARDDVRFFRSDLLADSCCVVGVPLLAKEQALGALWIARRTELTERDLRLFTAIGDIAANALYRVTLYEQTEIQLRHLIALHQIDIAITTNPDLDLTLQVILNNVRDELEIDATSILLLPPLAETLEYVAGIGFQTQAIEQARVKLGIGQAGRAALEQRTVICPDVRLAPLDSDLAALLADEGFLSHFVTPLIVKGQLRGVLEVFHRQPFKPDQEWLDYFETLATQAAIAIENAFLFENLQRSNTELKLAYDATIEGWSRALDLRDKETEGHTLRVTEMTLRLADRLGVSADEKVNLRRGALLHDIGKMGVPDTILLKPGPLTEDEWVIMRQHPTYAYEMLKPIEYLRPALDIPYCHHEKWDGSGYPRGLWGEAIPLAARIFAVVDVFDALIVDRPYRLAWPREKVLVYIREQAGQHFDPMLAEIFLQLES